MLHCTQLSTSSCLSQKLQHDCREVARTQALCFGPFCPGAIWATLEVDRLEVDRLEVDRLEVDRLEVDRLEVDRLEVDRLEVDRLPADSHPPAARNAARGGYGSYGSFGQSLFNRYSSTEHIQYNCYISCF